jgi:hypothetical protein
VRELNNPPDVRRLGGGPKRLAQLSAWPTNMGLVTVATVASIVPAPTTSKVSEPAVEAGPLAM